MDRRELARIRKIQRMRALRKAVEDTRPYMAVLGNGKRVAVTRYVARKCAAVGFGIEDRRTAIVICDYRR